MKRTFALLLVVLTASGCVETADSISREYRNLNNEAIDALMMVTSEARARTAVDRVLSEYENKLKKIEGKVKVFKLNNEKVDVLKQVYNSDSVAILILENSYNKQRLEAEKKRLALLFNTLKATRPDLELKYLEQVAKGGEKVTKIAQQLDNNDLLKLFETTQKDPKLNKDGGLPPELKGLSESFQRKLDKFKEYYQPQIPQP